MTPARRRAALARLDAELAAARLRRETLNELWGQAMYTRPEPGERSPEAVAVDIAAADARIAALEAEREELACPSPGVSAEPPKPVAIPSGSPANDATSAPANDAPAEPGPEFLTTRQAAALLGVSVKHLEGLRARGAGPLFMRVGHAVRYPAAELRTKK